MERIWLGDNLDIEIESQLENYLQSGKRKRSDSFIDLLTDSSTPTLQEVDYSHLSLDEIAISEPDLTFADPQDTLRNPGSPQSQAKPQLKQQPLKIGTLTYEERRNKIRNFLEKRNRRKFVKRISYDCRKRVADKRIRIKGRVVTKEQALALKKPSV